MKTRNFFFAAMAIALAALSCKKQDPFMQASVTLKKGAENTVIMQVTDNEMIKPVNALIYPGHDVRAIVTYFDKGAIEAPVGSKYAWRAAQVTSCDTILTKKPVLTAISNTGTEIYRNWINTLEDGYLTLCFEGQWGYPGTTHIMNLTPYLDIENPYSFMLCHDNNFDTEPKRYGFGLIAFDLHELLPENDGERVYIHYEGYNGQEKCIYFVRQNGVYDGPYSDNGKALGDGTETEFKSSVR